jgi:uncharacterized OsmC-like protein
MRAALAACDATTIAMRAAYVGVALESVEVTVESESDPRGVVGMTDDAPAGPLQLVTHIRVEAGNNDPSKVREVVDWALAHSPVADAMARCISKSAERIFRRPAAGQAWQLRRRFQPPTPRQLAPPESRGTDGRASS